MARTKSVVTQMQEVLDQMAELSKEDKPDKVRASVLTSRLDTLRYLHQQETASEVSTLAAENQELKKQLAELTPKEPAKSPAESLLDQQVAEMVRRHQQPVMPLTLTTPVTMTRSEPVTRPVEETDEDLLT